MMENSVKIEGFVRDYQDTVFTMTKTPVVIITLEHHRQGRNKVHTPWFRVFFLNDAYAEARALKNGTRIKVTGTLDTTSRQVEGSETKRRTYINGKEIEVVA